MENLTKEKTTIDTNLDPELNLVGAIFRTAFEDYEAGWKQIKETGGLEALRIEWKQASAIMDEYNAHPKKKDKKYYLSRKKS